MSIDWSLDAQIQAACVQGLERFSILTCDDGSVVWIVPLPRNPTISNIAIPPAMEALARARPSLLSAVRAGIYSGSAALAMARYIYWERQYEHEPAAPGGLRSYFCDGNRCLTRAVG